MEKVSTIYSKREELAKVTFSLPKEESNLWIHTQSTEQNIINIMEKGSAIYDEHMMKDRSKNRIYDIGKKGVAA